MSIVYGQTPLGDWQDGRSTWYTGWDNGNCNFGDIATNSFPYSFIAAPNTAFYNNGWVCGECYEIWCQGPWEQSYCPNSPGCLTPNSTVIVEVTDQCPENGNAQWCSGDITHFDLSQPAFDSIADHICGVIKTKYRRVSCNFGPNVNIAIANKDGINAWWYAFVVQNVDGYGDIVNVEITDSGSMSTWTAGEHQDYNAWLWQSSAGLKPPISVRLTDGFNQTLVGNAVVTTLTPSQKFDFGANFPQMK